MGVLVYVLGRSGTGKSFSMRNFKKEEIGVVNVQGKILPFKGSGSFDIENTDDSADIVKAIEKMAKKYKAIVVDDFQYVMANEFMRRSDEKGWDKFTDIARHAWDIANCVQKLPADVIVYVMCHTDTDQDGNEKLKTIGKLLDEKIVLEGMSTIVLKTGVTDGHYMFFTQNNGKDTTKSPAGMFPAYAIDNDLKYVDQKIRNYYEIGNFLTDEELKEIDEAVKHDEIPIKEEKKPRRGKRSEEKEEPVKAPSEEEKTEEPPDDGTDDSADTTGSAGSGASEGSGEEVRGRVSTRGRKRLRDDPERKAVLERNAERIANAGLENAPEGVTDLPFDQVKMPELEPLPKRKSRKAKEDAIMPAPETPAEDNKPAVTSRLQRRRRS